MNSSSVSQDEQIDPYYLRAECEALLQDALAELRPLRRRPRLVSVNDAPEPVARQKSMAA
ncbi:MAG: hypothetical protein LJE68_05435 [Rhodobacter sp.]|nr:hypothetical protein [Rhodobacter sp.]